MPIPFVVSIIRPFPLIFLLILAFWIPVFGQELKVLENGKPTLLGSDSGYLPDTPTRQKIDLSGTWSYTTDEEQWYEAEVPGSFDHEGKIIFLRKFSMTEPLLTASAFRLVALGINHEAEIFINDIFVGKHFGGYTSFQLEIPEGVIQPGNENAVKIVVSNLLSAKTTLPLRKQIWGWKNYGGILRDIYLLATPRLWIGSLYARSALDSDPKRGSVQVSTIISNLAFPPLMESDTLRSRSGQPVFQLHFELVDASSGAIVTRTSPYALTLEDGKDLSVDFDFPVYGIRLWTPEAPYLYRLQAFITMQAGKNQTVIDRFDTDFGFMSIATNGSDIVVNGRVARLKGVTWVEDSPGHGASMTHEEMERDVALMKVLGANAVRFAYHPPHPYMLSLCNRFGLFVLMEIPAWNVPAEILGSEVFQSLAEQAAHEMVRRDRNNPAVLAWGIGDDFDSSDPRARVFVERTSASIRNLDSRPVYYGSRMGELDACSDLVELVGVNIAAEDLSEFKNILAKWKTMRPDQPVMVLAYGTTVESGNHNGYSDPLSEEAQARFFMQHFGAMRDEKLAGSFVRSFADWSADRPILTVHAENPYLLPVGLVNQKREKRLAFDVLKTVFAGQKVAALPIGKHRSSFPVVHILSGFLVIFVVAYQYHYNRRFNEAMRRALVRSYNFFADLRDVRTVSIFHTLFWTIVISLTLAVVLSSLLYHYRADVFADYILTQVVVSDLIKEYMIRATWNPLEGILMFSGAFLILSVVVSIIVWISSLFIRPRISFTHAHSIVVWASVPAVFLIPLGMSLFKILQTPFYVVPSFVVMGIFLLWIVVRILKGMSVVFDMSSVKTYVGGFLVLSAALMTLIVYYDSEFSLIAYMEFIYNMVRTVG